MTRTRTSPKGGPVPFVESSEMPVPPTWMKMGRIVTVSFRIMAVEDADSFTRSTVEYDTHSIRIGLSYVAEE